MGTTNWDLFYISTHSLTRRLTLYPVLIIPHKDYFNSQPHKEADVDVTGGEPDEGISTHSLTRRLTMKIRVIHDFYDISTHSLTRRLTAILDKNIFIQN